MADHDSGSENLVFRGSGPDECESFISTIRKRAFSERRHRDNEWMAFLASSCFVGEALYWFEKLDEDIQEDWSRLRPALLARFGREETLPGPQHLSVNPAVFPTPAAAASAPAAAPPIVNATRKKHRRGYLKVVELGSTGRFCGYVASSLDFGRYRLFTQSPDDALVISLPFPSPRERFEIQILDTFESKSTNTLAVTWHGLAKMKWLEKTDTYWASLCSSTVVSTAWSTEQKVWGISTEGALGVYYPKPDGGFRVLEPRVDPQDLYLRETTADVGQRYKRARFVFEEAN